MKLKLEREIDKSIILVWYFNIHLSENQQKYRTTHHQPIGCNLHLYNTFTQQQQEYICFFFFF